MARNLPVGSRLGEYEIRRLSAVDELSVEYEATHRPTVRTVVVKEYFPNRLADRLSGMEVVAKSQAEQAVFDGGLNHFLALYQTLEHLDHAATVNVSECFRGNGTGYVVMEPPGGETLEERLRTGRTLSAAELRALALPLIDGLERVHGAGLLHRDINPEHILIRPDGKPVLIGFSASPRAAGGPRQAFGPPSPALSAKPSAGYAALEQYSHRGQEGPWTDIYALGAVLYRCVTGVAPTDAPGRAIHDDLVSAARAAAGGFDSELLAAIDAALALRLAERPRSVGAWRQLLTGTVESPGTPAGPRGRMAGRRTARARQVAASDEVRPNWMLPAVAATVFIALLTWLDTGVLRSSGGESLPGAEERQRIDGRGIRAPGTPQTMESGNLPEQPAASTDENPAQPDSAPSAPVDSVTREAASGPPDSVSEFRPRSGDTAQARAGTGVPEVPGIFDDGLPQAEPLDGAGAGESAEIGGPSAGSAEIGGGSAESEEIGGESAEPAAVPVHETPAEVPRDASRTATPVPVQSVVESPPAAMRSTESVVSMNAEEAVEPYTADAAEDDVAERGDGVPDSDTVGGFGGAVDSTLAEPDVDTELHPFNVTSEPAGAVVRFADGSRRYEPGMLLAPGEYRVVAELPGFSDWQGTIVHGATPLSHRVRMAALPTEYSDSLASGGEGPIMVRISTGGFRMGCVSGRRCFSNEMPVVEVQVENGFAISKHEISFSDFDRFAEAAGHEWVGASRGSERGAHPVVNVSWADAVAYTEWLSAETGRRYRLPTESEWEYAARAGSAAAYSWGNDLLPGRGNCNGCDNARSARGTAPVGSFPANAWGLHDMHGNVWEWVLNCAGPSRRALEPGIRHVANADCNRRVRRGGSWTHSPRRMRAASRDITVATLRSPNTGFRVVMLDP